jgi:hypothetical protein
MRHISVATTSGALGRDDHATHDLTEKLTELAGIVCCSLLVELTHGDRMDVIVMRRRADRLREVADRVIATHGVKHGGAEIVAQGTGVTAKAHKPARSWLSRR